MHLKEITFDSGKYPTRDCYHFNLPLLLACPQATIYTFDNSPILRIKYEQTDHYLVY
jgi:predicted ATPase